MSSAHHANVGAEHFAEYARIKRTPWFRRGLAIRKVLNRRYDVPWLGGSSVNLTKIYVDPRFSGHGKYGNRYVIVDLFIPALVDHEVTEGILLQLGRGAYDYDGAHELATAAELRQARNIALGAGLPWNPQHYQEMFKPFLRVTEQGPWPKLPPDLNLTPYRDDDPALFHEIERELLRQDIHQARR